MPAMKQIVLGAPEASVDIHHDWKWTLPFRESELAELVGVRPVGETNIGWRWLQSEDVFGHTDSGTDCIWRGSQISDFRFQISDLPVVPGTGHSSTTVPSPHPYFLRESSCTVRRTSPSFFSLSTRARASKFCPPTRTRTSECVRTF